ncbi:hypothetical protein MANES_03G048716v8 [Manihot esculenta]|uniref:Uncharacterized protein n=1 Tax=Manihot esculenta TaxID=3983 RepID=A0ACB7HXF9_MANES|nr:hypothetical protein MANES_03G048716v8 [Manihot esculenta]
MVIALKIKDKLCFINRKCEILDADLATYMKWLIVDNMVILWILNCLSKELAKSFLNATSAHQFWKEIRKRFGESGTFPLPIGKEDKYFYSN